VSEAKSGPTAAVAACVKAFVDTYLPERTVSTITKDAAAPSRAGFFWAPRSYTVLLTARGARSGNLIAEARCVANRVGLVVVLDAPVAARDKIRADFVVSVR
jgi:hypothetical protein